MRKWIHCDIDKITVRIPSLGGAFVQGKGIGFQFRDQELIGNVKLLPGKIISSQTNSESRTPKPKQHPKLHICPFPGILKLARR